VDPPAERFWPLAATRPVAGILAGTRSFLDRWAARAGPVSALWCDPAVEHAPLGTAPGRKSGPSALRRNAWPDPARGYRVALSTWVPPRDLDLGDAPAELRADGGPVAWRLDPPRARELRNAGDPAAILEALRGLGLRGRKAGGRRLDALWSLMDANPALLAEDAGDFDGADTVRGIDPFVLLGDARSLHVGKDVAIGPFVVLDVRGGPIVLDRGTQIDPHALLRGPLYVGPGSRILGGAVAGSSIGPACRVRGEVEQSVFQGYANKAHDGFVGHSVLGEWVNLGAGTITSDLKNTYGAVRLDDPSGAIDTGLLKLGAFLGDHVKTGIGTLLPTGCRIGVGSHVFGGGLAPKQIGDFTWHDGTGGEPVRWEPFVETAGLAMRRRDRRMAAAERAILAGLHAAAGGKGGKRKAPGRMKKRTRSGRS